jgi:hypothetical protein
MLFAGAANLMVGLGGTIVVTLVLVVPPDVMVMVVSVKDDMPADLAVLVDLEVLSEDFPVVDVSNFLELDVLLVLLRVRVVEVVK